MHPEMAPASGAEKPLCDYHIHEPRSVAKSSDVVMSQNSGMRMIGDAEASGPSALDHAAIFGDMLTQSCV